MLVDQDSSDKIRQATAIQLYPNVIVSGGGEISSPSMVYQSTVLTDVTLGGYSYFAPGCEASMVRVGNYTSIARGFIVGLGHPTDLLTASPVAWRPWMPGCEFPGRTTYDYEHSRIGSDVWIGANVVLKAGVTIGDGCIIGAGSIVTKDIPPFSVAVGNPCRVIRYRFAANVVERIQRLRWFDYDWRDQPIDWRTPEASLDAMEAALANGFDRRFEVFRYRADAQNIRFERLPSVNPP